MSRSVEPLLAPGANLREYWFTTNDWWVIALDGNAVMQLARPAPAIRTAAPTRL